MYDRLTIFGGMLPVFAVLVRYWMRSHVKVNCWFCGLNNRVVKKCRDGWICKHCEQYNGFKPDGDYNRDIPAQWDSSRNQSLSYCSRAQSSHKPHSNGLCEECNRNQEMKVAQLASFQPINPENFDHEIENFSCHLERAYRLCPPCEAVLEETLSRKKTHVLDMNLQMTGRNSQKGKYLSSKLGFQKSFSQTTSLLTAMVALLIAVSKVFTVSSDHVFIKFFGPLANGEMLSKNSSSYPVSFLSYLVPAPAVCIQPQKILHSPTEPELSSFSGSSSEYFELIHTFMLPLSVSCLTLQGISSCFASFQSTFFLWLALVGTVVFQNMASESLKGIQIPQIFEILFTILILLFSWKDIYSQKPKLTPVKRLKRDNSTHTKRCPESIVVGGASLSNVHKAPQVPSGNLKQSALLRTTSLMNFGHDALLDSSNYLSLPSRPSSVFSHRTLTSASGLLDNSTISPSIDALSSLSQEDTRSDASVDSAFSNPDSITLDAADSLNSSYQLPSGKKSDRQQGDVQSLIEGLSIGPINRQSRRKSAEFKTKSYVKEQKRSSLLSPAKLTNIMNESMASGIWRNTKYSNQLTSSLELNEQASRRPGSPCESINSHATVYSCGSLRNDLPVSSFQPMAPAWNSVASPLSLNMLSVAVPPRTLASNSGFCSPASPIHSPQVSHIVIPPNSITSNHGFGAGIPQVPTSPMSGPGVIYTPYGLFHQIPGPFGNPVYMMQPESPSLTNRSPASSFGSQFSPQSFSSSSQKDSNSFYDSDSQSSPKSSRRRMKTRSQLSSSFIESVWQSRFAILYTTLCYFLLGSVVYVFSYSGFATRVFFKVMDWKENFLTAMMYRDEEGL